MDIVNSLARMLVQAVPGAAPVIRAFTGESATLNNVAQTWGAATNDPNAYAQSVIRNASSSFTGVDNIVVPNMPNSKNFNLENPNEMANYQQQMQMYTQMLQLKSQIISMLHDTRKSMVQNLRA
jgi:hypothetical protein